MFTFGKKCQKGLKILHAPAIHGGSNGCSRMKRRSIGRKWDIDLELWVKQLQVQKKSHSSVLIVIAVEQIPRQWSSLSSLFVSSSSPNGKMPTLLHVSTVHLPPPPNFGCQWSPTATELMTLLVPLTVVLIFACTILIICFYAKAQWITWPAIMFLVGCFERTSPKTCSKYSDYDDVNTDRGP